DTKGTTSRTTWWDMLNLSAFGLVMSAAFGGALLTATAWLNASGASIVSPAMFVLFVAVAAAIATSAAGLYHALVVERLARKAEIAERAKMAPAALPLADGRALVPGLQILVPEVAKGISGTIAGDVPVRIEVEDN